MSNWQGDYQASSATFRRVGLLRLVYQKVERSGDPFWTSGRRPNVRGPESRLP